ncbi:unnamed protein product [Calypogeia fissa]
MDPKPLEQPDLGTDPRMRVRLMERGFHLQYTPTDHAPPQPPIKVLALKPGQHAWLCDLVHYIPSEIQRDTPIERMLQANNFARSDFDRVWFCICCSRGLYKTEDPRVHQALDPPHTRESLVEVVNSGGGYHIHSRTLTNLQVPVGDVLSHVISHPYTDGNLPHQCVYVHPNRGKMNVVANCNQVFNCATTGCDSVLSWTARDAHHQLYAHMPQFCSISCKLRTYAACPSGKDEMFDKPAFSYESNPGPEFFPTTTINRLGTTSTHGPDFQDRKNIWRTS